MMTDRRTVDLEITYWINMGEKSVRKAFIVLLVYYQSVISDNMEASVRGWLLVIPLCRLRTGCGLLEEQRQNPDNNSSSQSSSDSINR